MGFFSWPGLSGCVAGFWGGLSIWGQSQSGHTALYGLGLTLDLDPRPGAAGSNGLTSLTSPRAHFPEPPSDPRACQAGAPGRGHASSGNPSPALPEPWSWGHGLAATDWPLLAPKEAMGPWGWGCLSVGP